MRGAMRLILCALLCFAAANVQAGPELKDHNTTTTVSCTPDPGSLNTASTCTATVTDLGGQGPPGPPIGSVSFSSDSSGNFSATSCSLVATAGSSSACSVTYTPTVFGSGSHLVTASYSGGSDPFLGPGVRWLPSSGSYSLTINYPQPTISSVTPDTGLRGDIVSVTIAGSGFISGGTSVNFGANISVSNLTVNSFNEMTADLTIALAATTGARDVSVSNPTPGGGSNTLVNGFTVENPAPVITDLSPAIVEPGSGAVTVTINGSGFVPESIARFNGSPRPVAFVNSGQLLMDLSAADTSIAGDYPVTVENSGPGGGISNTAIFSVTSGEGGFDVVEPGAGLGTPLHTKLHATSFSFDILATSLDRSSIDSSFTGDVKVELLDASDDSGALDPNSCRSSWTVVATLPDQAFSSGDNGRIAVSHASTQAIRVARFRVTYPVSGPIERQGCSTDAFSIRPTSIALASSMNNGNPSGNPVLAAGDSFAMTATAVSGYDGTPQLDPDIEPHAGWDAKGAVTGSFNAADASTGVATGSFSYSEVGAFQYLAQGVYDDTFTAVDQPGGCTDDFSNASAGGLYGCKFGNLAATQWIGRFIPHHFDVALTDACTDAGGFTYSGQPFGVDQPTPGITITARNASGTTTQNYEYMSGDLVDDNNHSNDVTLSFNGSSAEFSPSTISFMDFSSGVFSSDSVSWTFSDPETEFTEVAPRATDTEGVSSAGFLEESTEIRSGRLVIANANASTITAANVRFELQAWADDGSGVATWMEHADDSSCTDLDQADFSLDNFTGNLASGETSINAFSYTPPFGSVTLGAPGEGNAGSLEITADLSMKDWLRFDADGNGTPEDAAATVKFFDIFKTEEGFINRREVVGQ